MSTQEERRKCPRFRPKGVTALVRSPSLEIPYHFQVKDMSADGVALGMGRPSDKALHPDDVVDVELWGFRNAIRARALVVRETCFESQMQGIALKLYAFENGDEEYYRSILEKRLFPT